MAGADTFRGISFQAAYSVGLALDVLEGSAEILVLEGDADVVDAATETKSGEVLVVSQAKTKVEPYVWGPAEIASVIQQWLAMGPAAGTRFEFVTDGTFGPAVTTRLAPALQRIGEGTATNDDGAYLAKLGLPTSLAALGHVSLRGRLPDGRTLLERATLRVLQLRERVDPVATDEARDLVWRLFGETVLGAGEAEVSMRRLDRARLGQIVGVAPEVIDDAEPWSTTLEARYREVLAAAPLDPAWTVLDVLGLKPVAALALLLERQDGNGVRTPRAASTLLDRSDDILLVGAAGAGKTTTIALLQREALARRLLPIRVSLSSYLPHTLERLLRRPLETVLGRALAPGVVGALLRRQDVIVFIDGGGELPQSQRAALLDDLVALRSQHVGARFVLAARDPAAVRGIRLATFEVQALDGDRRRLIATELAPGRDDLVGELERRLGTLVDNPLLFTMALGLALRGMRPQTRPEVFEGFGSGLEAREEGLTLSPAARVAVESCCYELRMEGRYNAEPWWWLERLTATRHDAIARGTLSPDTPSAESILSDLGACGLVRATGDGDLGLLHDLFCDWLASKAVSRSRRTLPDPVPQSLEEAVVFLGEDGSLLEEQLMAVAGNVVAAARVADVLPASEVDIDLAQRLWERLADQFGPCVRQKLGDQRLRVGSREPRVVWLAAPSGVGEARASPITCVAVAPVSALSLVVDLWLAVVRLGLVSLDPERPAKPVRAQADLARAIAETVLARVDALDELVSSISPGLLDRVQSAVGPRGIHGSVLPAVEHAALPFGDGVVVEHPFHYSVVADGVRVVAADEAPENARFITTAESFARDAPRAAARKQLTNALVSLMPRFDD